MTGDRSFSELNLWQRIFAEHWDEFRAGYRAANNRDVPEHWDSNVERMLDCGDIGQGYYEYLCGDCDATTKVGFTCKSRLCLRCFKVAVDNWLETARKVLFEGVVHRQIVLTIPVSLRPLVLADERFLKVFADAGAGAVRSWWSSGAPKRKSGSASCR